MIKIVELFSGIGDFRQAAININLDHEITAISEINIQALLAYRAIYNDYNVPNLRDIKYIQELPICDLVTYGFPCQDLSVAGYGAGIQEGTRSGLLLEVERLLKISYFKNKLPENLIMENVQALVQKNHIMDFERWLYILESMGYKNYWKVINSNNHGIPQSRNRVFLISTLNNKKYEFPENRVLKLKLKDLLEQNVDEKYFINSERTNKFYEMYKEKIDILEDGLYPFLTPDRLKKTTKWKKI